MAKIDDERWEIVKRMPGFQDAEAAHRKNKVFGGLASLLLILIGLALLVAFFLSPGLLVVAGVASASTVPRWMAWSLAVGVSGAIYCVALWIADSARSASALYLAFSVLCTLGVAAMGLVVDGLGERLAATLFPELDYYGGEATPAVLGKSNENPQAPTEPRIEGTTEDPSANSAARANSRERETRRGTSSTRSLAIGDLVGARATLFYDLDQGGELLETYVWWSADHRALDVAIQRGALEGRLELVALGHDQTSFLMSFPIDAGGSRVHINQRDSGQLLVRHETPPHSQDPGTVSVRLIAWIGERPETIASWTGTSAEYHSGRGPAWTRMFRLRGEPVGVVPRTTVPTTNNGNDIPDEDPPDLPIANPYR